VAIKLLKINRSEKYVGRLYYLPGAAYL